MASIVSLFGCIVGGHTMQSADCADVFIAFVIGEIQFHSKTDVHVRIGSTSRGTCAVTLSLGRDVVLVSSTSAD